MASDHAAEVGLTVELVMRLAYDYTRSDDGLNQYGRRSRSRGWLATTNGLAVVVGSA